MLKLAGLTALNLAPVNFEIASGECVTVTGPSGAGKTVFLRAIADLDPNGGEAWLDNRARHAMTAPAWRRLVGYMPAEPAWWADAVADHFLEQPGDLIEALGLPAAILDWPIARLSTGERQRLAFIRMAEREPRVFLLDEPTGALDADSTTRLEHVLQGRMDAGAAILIVTHDAAQGRRLASRHLHVEGGRLEERSIA